jgi:hypothetical protein
MPISLHPDDSLEEWVFIRMTARPPAPYRAVSERAESGSSPEVMNVTAAGCEPTLRFRNALFLKAPEGGQR